MNILYLHGLESKLSDAKRAILENYGTVYAPDINYDKARVQPREILDKYPDVEFNVIMGSSMGALNGYLVSEAIGRPALLFNPPLAKYPNPPIQVDEKYTKGLATKHFVLGGQDQVVNPTETLNYLSSRLAGSAMVIHVEPGMAHRIPIPVFKEQVQKFFDSLCS